MRRRSPSWPNIRLALTGNYSTQFLARAFPLALAARNLAAEVYEISLQPMARRIARRRFAAPCLCADPCAAGADLDRARVRIAAQPRSDRGVRGGGRFEAALKTTEAHILVTLPEPLADEVCDSGPAYAWRRAVCGRPARGARLPRATLIDLEPLMRATGARPGSTIASTTPPSCPFIRTARRPCSAFWPTRSPALIAPRCKLVIVDLDDTLWGGRVGDDGYDGIDLDPAGKRPPFPAAAGFSARAARQGHRAGDCEQERPRQRCSEVFAKRGGDDAALRRFRRDGNPLGAEVVERLAHPRASEAFDRRRDLS